METMEIVLPDLSTIEHPEITVKSHSTVGVTYVVNLAEMSCTCEDFFNRRQDFEKHEANRLCKHLCAELGKVRYQPYFDELTRAIIKSGCKEDIYCRDKLSDGTEFALGVSNGREWVSIYQYEKSEKENGKPRYKHKRYGYSLLESRWSYDEKPPKHQEILKAIGETINVTIVREGAAGAGDVEDKGDGKLGCVAWVIFIFAGFFLFSMFAPMCSRPH